MGCVKCMFIVFCAFVGAVLPADVFQYPVYPTNDHCTNAPAGGVDWILHVRKPNYGWGENTARANIALAVNRWKGTRDEMTNMALQLEDEIITALMSSPPIPDTDLALFIHALIATEKNPRNFNGIDLVEVLLNRVDSYEDVHPFLVLALCNSRAVEFNHLEKIKKYTKHTEGNSTLETREAEKKALALKAFACAADLPDAASKRLNKFGHSMEEAAKCLVSKQSGGVFGNAYTTSLAVQALTAYDKQEWEEQKSLDFLRKESVLDVNMVKTYYIEMALNCRSVKFIKDLYNVPYVPVKRAPTHEFFTTFTIKDEKEPDIYFSVIMKIPVQWTFFNVMEKASELSNRFNFSHVMDKNNHPSIYKVIGKPNDAEENMFWRICRQTNVNHDPHTSNITTFADSPVMFTPEVGEHVILWYRSTACPLG